MAIKIIEKSITRDELSAMALEQFGDFVKAVVDIRRGIMAVGGELHADEEGLLIEYGARQEDLWGINIYPKNPDNEIIEFDSMINLRPRQNNRSRGVDNPETRAEIIAAVNKLLSK